VMVFTCGSRNFKTVQKAWTSPTSPMHTARAIPCNSGMLKVPDSGSEQGLGSMKIRIITASARPPIPPPIGEPGLALKRAHAEGNREFLYD